MAARGTLAALVREAAARWGGRVAVDDAAGHTLTWAELAAVAARASCVLRRACGSSACGGAVGVALLVEEGFPLVAASLAVSAVGPRTFFVPFDARTPYERFRRLAEAVPGGSVRVVVVSDDGAGGVAERARADGYSVVAFDALLHGGGEAEEEEEAEAGTASPPPPEELCYVQHTSGTTGTPQPLGFSHSQVAAYAYVRCRDENITPDSRILMASAATFDPSQGDLFAAALSGATLVSPARAALLADPGRVVREGRVTHVCASPSMWSLVDVCAEAGGPAAAYPDLRVVALGGEAMPEAMLAAWGGDDGPRLDNVYGVTECTVYQARKTLGHGGASTGCGVRSIGSPTDGVTFSLRPLPEGVCVGVAGAGELCVGGQCVARSIVLGGGCSGGVYATGDVAAPDAADEDGGYVLLGRLDTQMKVNGVRMDPTEVERVLERSRVVAQACVVKHPTAAKLVAVLVLRGGGDGGKCGDGRLHETTRFALTSLCRASLPLSLVPRTFVATPGQDRLPSTANGKLDRRRVAEEAAAALADGQSAAAEAAESEAEKLTPLEEAVAAVWEDVLALPAGSARRRGADWHALGGTSLLAALAVRRLRAAAVGGEAGAGWGGVGGRATAEAAGDAALFLHADALYAGAEGAVLGGDAECFMGMCDGGTYAPCRLLEADTLGGYCAYLAAGGVCAAGEVEVEVEEASAPPPEESSSHAARMLADVVRAGRSAELRDLVAAVGVAGLPRPPATGRGALSLLHVAAARGHAGVVECLVGVCGLPVHGATRRGACAAHLAAAGGHADALRVLLRPGRTGAGVRDAGKQTLLHYAARSGQVGAVRAVLAQEGAVRDALDAQFRAPLHWAVLHRHVSVVLALLAAGCRAAFPPVPPAKHARRTRLPPQAPVDLAVGIHAEAASSPDERAAARAMCVALARAGACGGRTRPEDVAARRAAADAFAEDGFAAEAEVLRAAVDAQQAEVAAAVAAAAAKGVAVAAAAAAEAEAEADAAAATAGPSEASC